MMSCNCRTAALRIFVRSITSTISPEPARSHLFRSPYSQLRAVPARRFHETASRSYGSEVAATIARQDDVSSRPTRIRNDAPSEQSSKASSTRVPKKRAPRSRATDDTAGGAESKPRTRKTKPGKEDDAGANGKKSYPAKRGRPAGADQGQSKPVKGRNAEDDAPKPPEEWKARKASLKEKFPEGWNPRKKLSPDALDGIRALHEQHPDIFTTEELSKRFEVSPEAIRRILKSKWRAAPGDEEDERQERWFKRGKKVWARWAELGKKPPRRWRQEGIVRDPSWHQPRTRPEDRIRVDTRTLSKGKRMRLIEKKRREMEASSQQSLQAREKARMEKQKTPQQVLSETLV